MNEKTEDVPATIEVINPFEPRFYGPDAAYHRSAAYLKVSQGKARWTEAAEKLAQGAEKRE